MTAFALKVVTTKRPISGAVIGVRIVLAHINRAQYDMESGEYVQSFHPKYRITESGDYKKVTPEIMEKFIARAAKWHKLDITRIEVC